MNTFFSKVSKIYGFNNKENPLRMSGFNILKTNELIYHLDSRLLVSILSIEYFREPKANISVKILR